MSNKALFQHARLLGCHNIGRALLLILVCSFFYLVVRQRQLIRYYRNAIIHGVQESSRRKLDRERIPR
jgi:hypothetical protein